MGMYHYITVNLRVRPDATAVVHRVLNALCDDTVLAEDDSTLSNFLADLERETGDSKTLDHRFFKSPRWNDIFGNWAGDSEDWAWNDEGPIRQYVDGLLTVRCSFKSTYDYENLADWLKPWLVDDADNCIFGWYEEFKDSSVPPTVYYGTIEAVRKIAPHFGRDAGYGGCGFGFGRG